MMFEYIEIDNDNTNDGNDINDNNENDNNNDIIFEERLQLPINTFRYKFSEEFMIELYNFSKIHQHDDRESFRLTTALRTPVLELRKAIALYEVEMSYWRHRHNRDGERLASIEDTENKKRIYQVLTSSDYEGGTKVYMNVHY